MGHEKNWMELGESRQQQDLETQAQVYISQKFWSFMEFNLI